MLRIGSVFGRYKLAAAFKQAGADASEICGFFLVVKVAAQKVNRLECGL